ncbi:MAG: alpha/beta fold hydrolase, partial [Gemmatimonadota bacterium]
MGSTRVAAMSRVPSGASAVRTLGVVVPFLLVPAAMACGPDTSDDTAATADATPAEDAGTAGEHSGYLTGAEGGRLFFRVIGNSPDTVVVLHGGPGAGMNSVRPAFEPLADELSLIFFDQRGGGRSALPADTSLLRASYFIEDLDSVRAHFGLERMNLLTHSFGAVLAAAYAREHPGR